MLSAMSCSAEVMKRLTPSMCQVPSACWMALVRPAPTSEPASGSVSTIVAPQRPSTIRCGDLALLLGAEAVDHVREAGPEAYMCTAGLEPRISSATAHRRLGGTTVPPSSSGRSIRHHSASM